MNARVFLTTLSSLVTYPAILGSLSLPLRRRRYFTMEKQVPPLSRDVSLSMKAGTNSTGLSIPQRVPSNTPELPVLYTNSPTVASQWLSDNVPSKGCVLGFDVESVPKAAWVTNNVLSGPATVQLSTPDSALVIHLTNSVGRRSRSCAPVLQAVLSDSSIIKAGVGIDFDVVELYKHLTPVKARSRLDIGGFGATLGRTAGLKRLASSILGVNLIKSRKLSSSNWGRVPLTNAQLEYCARDAWVSAAVLSKLQEVDPELFGVKKLVQLLKNQRPIHEVYRRAKKRKDAQRNLQSSKISPKRRKELLHVVQETAPDPTLEFDLRHVGFEIFEE